MVEKPHHTLVARTPQVDMREVLSTVMAHTRCSINVEYCHLEPAGLL